MVNKKKFYSKSWALCIMLLFPLSILAKAESRVIITTTTHIGNIVHHLGGTSVSVKSLIPWGMCPGHFDLKPHEVKLFKNADLLLTHGFEGEHFLSKIVEMTKHSHLVKQEVGIAGNWMVPHVQLRAAEKIVTILKQFTPQKSNLLEERFLNYQKQIQQKSHKISKKASALKVREYKIVCSDMQQQFLQWLGFKVIATYGRPDELTPQHIMTIVDKAKENGVKLVVDNLQSGPKAGLSITKELDGIHIVLNNFPKESYLETLTENAGKLFTAVNKLSE